MRLRWWIFGLPLAACSFDLDPLQESSGRGGATPVAIGGCGASCASGGSAATGTGGSSSGGAPTGGSAGAPGGGGAAGTSAAGGSGATGAASSGGSSSGGTGAAGGGGAPAFACADVTKNTACWEPSAAACRCLGCDPYFCLHPTSFYPLSDCVCPSCWGDPDCNDTKYCFNDGKCDPYDEGCSCPDCYAHPLCQ